MRPVDCAELLSRPAVDAVVFDCDGTLSQIEGIIWLAEQQGVAEEVAQLTEQAMSRAGLSLNTYQQRLASVRPTYEQALCLALAYEQHKTEHALEVIAACQAAGIAVFVISAGINPSVQRFSQRLGVPAERVYAVDVYYDDGGAYVGFDEHSPLVMVGGKLQWIRQLQRDYPRILHVGDGMNDVETAEEVECFVGYGYHYPRPSVEQHSTVYLKEASMAPVLTLAMGCQPPPVAYQWLHRQGVQQLERLSV